MEQKCFLCICSYRILVLTFYMLVLNITCKFSEKLSHTWDKKKCWSRKYVKKIDSNMYQCWLCGINLKMPMACHSIARFHISLQHPDVFKKEMNMNKKYKARREMLAKKKNKDKDNIEQNHNAEEIIITRDIYDTISSNENDETELENPHTSVILKNPTVSYYQNDWVLSHCRQVKDDYYECLVCHTIMKLQKGCFSPMRLHIRNAHPYVKKGISYKNKKGMLTDNGIV